MKTLQKLPAIILILYLILINTHSAFGQTSTVGVHARLTDGDAATNCGPSGYFVDSIADTLENEATEERETYFGKMKGK